MVVLESGSIMSSSGANNHNQYLQPDYLSPLPTTLDAKKSPLALLAQTCSQIGADPSTKTISSSVEKSKKSDRHSSSPSSQKSTPIDFKINDSSKLAFKPYENNVLTKKADSSRPSSKNSSSEHCEDRRSESRTPNRKSSSPGSTKAASPFDRTGSSPNSSKGASPIIRSGHDVLNGKDTPLGSFKPPTSLNSLSTDCYPPGMDPSNPAFRPPFAGAPFSPQNAALLAAAAAGYPGSVGPYVSYARVKTPSGGETLVPVCKDPYCTGCPLSMHNSLLGTCPSGCTQCDHQKNYLASALSMIPPPHPLSYQLGRPYVCNWIAGESYCGKRFNNSEDLLQHLRTHTSSTSSSDSSALLNPLRYPNPPLSPLSLRYHPYSKPGVPASLPPSPFSPFSPLNPFYSPFSLYGQRMGAAVHP
ncbi:hypothetical protein WDU94_004075 [Cyamophila willieti]